MIPILTITGSDNSGFSGLQLDLRIISEMGCHALTSATCIVMQSHDGIKNIVNFPPEVIGSQVAHIASCFHPKTTKVGLVRTPDAVKAIRNEIIGCRKVVVAPGIMASNGTQLIDDETIEAIKYYLIPNATLVVLRQIEAEKMLNTKITTNEEMLLVARKVVEMGAEYVMLRGGKITEGRLTALLASKDTKKFFSSYNIEGWQQHGVGGALSTAIATRLAMGDDVPTAVKNAHEFVHSRIVYSVETDQRKLRPSDIYNTFMNLLSDNYMKTHEVMFYADKLNITTRYLSQITNETVKKTPKQIIAEYLLRESKQMLENSRLSVKEVASYLGFSSTALFCKFFKAQTGETPSGYRLSAESLQ